MKCTACFTVFLLLVATSSTSIAQHLTSAKLYLQQQQYEKAEASALKAVDKDPEDEEGWFVLGRARYELKKYREMVDAFDKAIAIDPKEHKNEIGQYRLKVWADSYNAGVRLYNKGRDTASYFQSAVDSFQTAIAVMPDSLRVYYVCALAHYGNQDVNKAIQVLNASLNKNPNGMDELELLGRLHLQLGRDKAAASDTAGSKQEYALAQETFEKIYALDPTNIENIMRLMELYEQLGMREKALAMTRDALVNDPGNGLLRFAHGVFLLKQDKFEESIEELKKVLELGSELGESTIEDATYNLGVAYLNWGVAMKEADDKRIEAAMKKGNKNVKEDLSYKKKYEEALPYLEEATRMKRNDVTLWQQLGKVYANLNRLEDMKRAFAVVDSLMKGN